MSVYYYIGLPQQTTDAGRDTEVKIVPTFRPFVVDERTLPVPTAPHASNQLLRLHAAARATAPCPKIMGCPCRVKVSPIVIFLFNVLLCVHTAVRRIGVHTVQHKV